MSIQAEKRRRERDKKFAPPGGLEPPTFRLTAERASQLRHGGGMLERTGNKVLNLSFLVCMKLESIVPTESCR